MAEFQVVNIPRRQSAASYNRRGSKYDAALEAAMGIPAGKALVVPHSGHSTPYVFARTLAGLIKRRSAPLRVIVRGDQVMLVRGYEQEVL